MTEQPVTDTPEKKSSLKDKSLKIAGYSYMLGDVSMVAAGMARGKDGKSTVQGAIIWFLGGIFAAIWGNPKPEEQLKIQASKLEHYLKQKGVEVPDDARAQSQLLKKKSFMGHVSQFLYEHPSEMLNAMYAIGAAILLHGSVKNTGGERAPFLPKTLNRDGLISMNSDFWIGALVLAGATTGLLVKEDPEARKKAEGKGALQKAYAFVAEKPLRVTGTLYGLNNIFLGAKAMQDHELRNSTYSGKSLKPHMASTTQFAAYVFSNIMLFLSRRDQTSGKGTSLADVAKLEDAAARVIAAQTPEKQRELLADVSEYMAAQKGMKLSASEIAAQLSQRIAAITEERLQPSVNQVKWAHREEARQQTPHADMTPLAGR